LLGWHPSQRADVVRYPTAAGIEKNQKIASRSTVRAATWSIN